MSADPAKISHWLIVFGKQLHKSAKAYGIHSETINAVTAARLQVRMQLTLAWDLACSWIAKKPFDHHPAMPVSMLLALLAVCLWPG